MAKAKFDINDESKSMTTLIFLLAWPVFIEQILTTLVGYADTAMVGAMGKEATAAVTISNSPIFLLNGVIMALGVGITTMVAQATGAGNKDLVKKLIRHAFLVIIFIGIPITALIAALSHKIPLWMGAEQDVLELATTYNLIVSAGRLFSLSAMILNSVFRGYGDTKTPLFVNVLMNGLNVVGNYFLINPTREINILGTGLIVTMPGAGLGVAGAAIATALGMFIAGTLAIIIAFTRKNGYNISFKDDFSVDWKLSKKIFSISLPAMLERICMSSSGIFVSSSIATLGTTSVAANSLALTAESMSYMPAFAFQTASTTLVGQSIGARRIDRAEGFVKRSLILGITLMCATGTVLFLFAPQLVSLFTPDAEVIAMAAKNLKVVAFIQPIQVVSWIFAGALRGAGDTKSTFIITASTQWGIRTLFSVILIRVFHQDLYAIQFVILVEQIARMVLLYVRFQSGHWKEIGNRHRESMLKTIQENSDANASENKQE